MKIENDIIQFHPQFNPQKWTLTDLQKQYIAVLTGGDSIQNLVERFYQSGWLVNFTELFQLIESLTKQNVILNQNFKDYFLPKTFNKGDLNRNSMALTSSKPTKSSTINLADLLKLPFLRSLPEPFAKALLSSSEVKTIPAENFICKTHDVSRELYILISGQAAIYKNTHGHQQFISILNPPSVFGESAFLLGHKRTADIVTTQQSQILCINYQKDLMERALNIDKAEKILERFWIHQALANSDFFKKIPSDCLDALIFSGKILRLSEKQVLFRQNDSSSGAYLVIQGHIDIIKDQKLISRMNQGSFLGEVSLFFTGGLRSATAYCPHSAVVLEISRDQFYRILSHNLILAKELQSLAYQRVQQDQKRL